MRSGSSVGTPMSTVTSPGPLSRTVTGPDGLSSRTVSPIESSPARCSHAATQRTPLPHWPDGVPSAFQMP